MKTTDWFFTNTELRARMPCGGDYTTVRTGVLGGNTFYQARDYANAIGSRRYLPKWAHARYSAQNFKI